MHHGVTVRPLSACLQDSAFDCAFLDEWGNSIASMPRADSEMQEVFDATAYPAFIMTQETASELVQASPRWLQDYIAWHQATRQQLTIDNWNETRYFVQRCLTEESTCGGTSDRLRSMPLKIRLAAEMNRLLVITWERPAALQEYLVPPSFGGIDWTVPDWLAAKLQYDPNCFVSHNTSNLQRAYGPTCPVAHSRYHFGYSGGAEHYNQLKTDDEPDFVSIYNTIWRLLFQPSVPVLKLIVERMNELGLQPNEYNALHIRSQYSIQEGRIPDLVENATNCGLSFGTHGMPLYIATDSLNATRNALTYASQFTDLARAHFTDESPLHLNRANDYLSRDNEYIKDRPELYYDTFVDLYLLAHAKCRALGRGTFGYWANLMSADPTCVVNYFDTALHQYSFPDICRRPEMLLHNRQR